MPVASMSLLSSFEILTPVENANWLTRVKTHKLLLVCKQVVTNLFTSCSHCLFLVVVTSLKQAVNNL